MAGQRPSDHAVNPPSLKDRVRAYIASHDLIPSGAPVLVAVSGGVDSMGLLHVLRALGHNVRAAHFDHATRAGESARDAEFVANHCAALGVSCSIGHWSDWAKASTSGDSFEMDARARRYAFLADTAGQCGCTRVATGHHRDDQAETVLLRLLRGAGPGGLAGIRARRPLTDHIDLIRPLLGCPRAALETYAVEHGIAWREDASNANCDHLRNRLRHEILPQLVVAFDAQLPARLAQTAEIVGMDDALLATLSAEAARDIVLLDRVQREAFAHLHPALQRRVLLGWLHGHGIAMDHAHVLAAVDFILHSAAGKRLSLNGDALLHAASEAVLLVNGTQEESTASVALPAPGQCSFLGQRFALRFAPMPSEPLQTWCSPTRQVFDADRLVGALCLRTREPGDVFQPLGQSSAQKLQDYLINRRVPQPDRDALPLLLVGDAIAWVVGHAPSAQFAVTPATTRVAVVEVSPCA